MTSMLDSLSYNVLAQGAFPKAFLYDGRYATHNGSIVHGDTLICIGATALDIPPYNQGIVFSRFDSCGQLKIVHKYFDPDGQDYYMNYYKMCRTENGEYVFGGALGNGEFTLLIKTTENGDTIFTKAYPRIEGYGIASSFFALEKNTNIYSFGIMNDPRVHIHLLKVDQMGGIQFSKIINTTINCDIVRGVHKKGDNFIISGYHSEYCDFANLERSKGFFLEIDTNGTLVREWVDSVSGNYFNGGGLMPTPDGGWVTCGTYSDSFALNTYWNRNFITKWDGNFNKQWTTFIGDPTHFYNYLDHIKIDADGNYIVGGNYVAGVGHKPSSPFQLAGIVAKVSSTGAVLWTNLTKVYWDGIHPSHNYILGLDLLSSGSIMASGYLLRKDTTITRNEAFITKISPNGQTFSQQNPLCGTVSVEAVHTPVPVQTVLYPNPATDDFHLLFGRSESLKQSRFFYLHSSTGQKIKTVEILPGTDDLPVSISDLRTGVYFWSIWEGSVCVGKGRMIKAEK